jgi:hypothetical protein
MLPWVLPFEGLPDGSLERAFARSPLTRFTTRAATRGRAPQSIDQLPPDPFRRQRQAAPSGSDSPLRVSAPVESQALGSAGVRAMDSPCAARGIAARYDALRTLRQACRSCRDPAEVPSPRLIVAAAMSSGPSALQSIRFRWATPQRCRRRRRPPGVSCSFRGRFPSKYRPYGLGGPAMPLAISSASRFSFSGRSRTQLSARYWPLIEFRPPAEFSPADPSRTGRSRPTPLMGFASLRRLRGRRSTIRGPASPLCSAFRVWLPS